MNARIFRSGLAALVIAGGMVAPAQAATVLFTDDFGGSGYALNTAPTGWTSADGTVDWLAPANGFGLACRDGSTGCVDLDGSTGQAGMMTTDGTFNLIKGTTYLLQAYVSGNQLGSSYPERGPDSLSFGFRDGSTVFASSSLATILAGQPFTLISLLFTPDDDVTARIFFQAGGGDDVGPILDDVSLTAVPLPAAVWLLLSGLVGFVAMGRRRTSA